MTKRRIAVIGGVAAGPAAAAEAVRVDPDAEVVLYEQGEHISYGACELPYFVSDWIEDFDRLIVLTPEEFEKTRGAAVRVGHRVLEIDPKRKTLTAEATRFGSIHVDRFDQVILATGARPKRLEIEGEDAPNVVPVRTLDDAVRIKAQLEDGRVKHVVIMGGSYIGLEMAEAVRARGLRATIVEPTGRLLVTLIDDGLRDLVHERVRHKGVLVRKDLAVALDHDAEGRVTAIRTEQGEKIGCQLVLVAIGLKPNSELGGQVGARLGRTGALSVDPTMRTNVRNVWACGDCIEVERVVDRRPIHLPLSPVAFRTARIAARNAARRGAGPIERFPGVVGLAGIKIFELEVAGIGITESQALEAGFDAFSISTKHVSRAGMYPGARPIHIQYTVERGTGRLLGAALVGDEGVALRSNVLSPLIHRGGTVFELADFELIYTPPVAPARDPLLIAASVAGKEAKKAKRVSRRTG